MEYIGKMDPECIAICDAVNRIPGLRTTESCCGHGEHPFRVFFSIQNLQDLAPLLFYIDSCHIGFNWNCKSRTDCAMQPAYFFLESEVMGQKAYDQANEIADAINDFMDDGYIDWKKDWYGDPEQPKEERIVAVVKEIREQDCGAWLKDCISGISTCNQGTKQRFALAHLLGKLYRIAGV
jgi:hypothetical protein